MQGWTINRGEDVTVVAAFVVRETQGWEIIWGESFAVIVAFVALEAQ